MKNNKPIPCGSSLPQNNPHAVSVHFETIADVIAFEENDAEMLKKMESGYPRFKMNRLLEKAYNIAKKENNISDEFELLPISSDAAFDKIRQIVSGEIKKIACDGLRFAALPKQAEYFQDVKYLIQHSGMIPSSRKAEDFLLNRGILGSEFIEEKHPAEGAEQEIKEILSNAYGFSTQDDVFLCTAGMNSVYSVFEAIKTTRQKEGRNIFIQAGWLYLDTMEILRKYSSSVFKYFNPMALHELEKYIEENHSNIAAIFTEIPNNPSISCFDLPGLSEIAKKHNIALVIDSTMATPFNAKIFPYADVVVESLTKFACGYGDVLMGAIVLDNQSEIANSLKQEISRLHEKPYMKDIRRLAFEIKDYEQRVKTVSKNTLALASYFETKPQIKKISWALDDISKSNFLKIRKSNDDVPGLISIVFDKDLHYYFDKLNLAKGPSLGTDFTLAMPYVYLAHYGMLQTEEGKKMLSENGIDKELLRVSVGLENVDDIIAVFEEALN